MVHGRSTRATVRLEPHKSDISLEEIKLQIYSQLMRQGTLRSGYFPFCIFERQQRPWTRVGDFRDRIMADLSPTPPVDETECLYIKRILADDFERRQIMHGRHAEKHREVGGEALAIATSLADQAKRELESVLVEPLSKTSMQAFAHLEVKLRIKRMLDDDAASGRLAVTGVDGKKMVSVDALVRWAVLRKIVVEQDARRGFSSLVDASYQSVHKPLCSVAAPANPARPVEPAESTNEKTLEPSHWKMRVQAEATAMWRRLIAAGANPTVNSTKDDLARWCRANNVKTDSGLFPNAEYLRTHVLSGKHWPKADRPK